MELLCRFGEPCSVTSVAAIGRSFQESHCREWAQTRRSVGVYDDPLWPETDDQRRSPIAVSGRV